MSSLTEETAIEKVPLNNGVEPIPKLQRSLLYLSICAAMFLSLVDTSIVATALYTIGSDFAALNEVTWVALAYSLAYLGWSVPFAALADVLGRRSAYNLAFLLFLAFSLACGWSQSLTQLIAFRTFQGIGGAGLYSITMVIFPETTPVHLNKLIGALAGMVVAVAGVAGPVLGGVITRYTTWRWIFWINGPVVVIAMILFNVTWPRPDQLQATRTRRKWKELDVVGSMLIIAASVLTVYAFQTAGIKTNTWTSAGFLAPLLTGCLAWALLFLWQWAVDRWWRDRIAAVVPWHLLKQRVYVAGAAFTLLMGFPYLLIIYSLPLRFQIVNGASPLYAGVWLLPMLGASAIGSTVAGMINSKRDYIFHTFVVGSVLLTLGTGLLITLDADTAVQHKTFGFEVFVGLGFGLSIATVSLSTALEASLRDAAVAQGIVSQARVFGGSLGIAASTAILGATEQRELAGKVSPDQLSSLQSSHSSLSPAQLQAVQQSYSDAFSLGLKVCTAISALTLIAALSMYRSGPAGDLMERRRNQLKEEMQRAARDKPAPVETVQAKSDRDVEKT